MKIPLISVRARLLVLCLGLVTVCEGANLSLGYLISQNEARQLAQQEQYRRQDVIREVQQAMEQARHVGGQLNSAKLMAEAAEQAKWQPLLEEAKADVFRKLDLLRSFDPHSAELVLRATSEVTGYQEHAIDALVAGRRNEAAPIFAEAQTRLNLIQDTLTGASQHARAQAQEMHARERQKALAGKRLSAIIILVTSVTSLLLTFIVIRSIIRPLKATIDAIRQVNAGQTAVDLPPVTADEFGDMALALRQMRDQAERLRKLAYEDSLTGIGNRARLDESLQEAITACRQAHSSLAVLYLDLDNFRAVNDTWGHRAGDRYLCEAVSRLHRFLPEEALLCRYSGDSFVVLIQGLSRNELLEPRLREIAECALRGLAEPYPINNQLMNMSVSIGIAAYPGDGETVEQLISGADAAMGLAKKNGRNNVRFAAAQTTGSYRRQLALAGDVRRGLEKAEFEAFYQPIIDVERGKTVGAEALLRWHHPERGLLLPGEFIPIAEQTGLINRLGELCLTSAHRQSQIWRNANRQLRIAVNLSVHQVHAGKILGFLKQMGDDTAPAERVIDFELTESALLDAAENGQNVLDEIKRMGYRLGLDDFGTGYSSLSYLQRLPIDKIKIDRQFVAGMQSSKAALAIVSAVLALARNLDLEVIAEGVETVEQSRQLADLGCNLQQGFLFSRALCAADFERWVHAYERDVVLERAGGRPGPTLIRG